MQAQGGAQRPSRPGSCAAPRGSLASLPAPGCAPQSPGLQSLPPLGVLPFSRGPRADPLPSPLLSSSSPKACSLLPLGSPRAAPGARLPSVLSPSGPTGTLQEPHDPSSLPVSAAPASPAHPENPPVWGRGQNGGSQRTGPPRPGDVTLFGKGSLQTDVVKVRISKGDCPALGWPQSDDCPFKKTGRGKRRGKTSRDGKVAKQRRKQESGEPPEARGGPGHALPRGLWEEPALPTDCRLRVPRINATSSVS